MDNERKIWFTVEELVRIGGFKNERWLQYAASSKKLKQSDKRKGVWYIHIDDIEQHYPQLHKAILADVNINNIINYLHEKIKSTINFIKVQESIKKEEYIDKNIDYPQTMTETLLKYKGKITAYEDVLREIEARK